MGSADLVLFSWIANGGTPFYLKPHERVNTILTYFARLSAPRAKPDVVRRVHSGTRQRARAVVRSRSGPIAHHLSPIVKNVALVKTATAEAAVWAEAERMDELSE